MDRRVFLTSLISLSSGIVLSACGLNTSGGPVVPQPGQPVTERLVIQNLSSNTSAPGIGGAAAPGFLSIGVLKLMNLSKRPLSIGRITFTAMDEVQSGVPVGAITDMQLTFEKTQVNNLTITKEGNRVTVSLMNPITLPATDVVINDFYLWLGVMLSDGVGRVLQLRIDNAADIDVEDDMGNPVAIEIYKGAFPVMLTYLRVERGGVLMERAVDSPSGAVNLPANTPNQCILAVDVTAIGEDARIGLVSMSFNLANGLAPGSLANLRIQDSGGMLIGTTVSTIPDQNPRFESANLSYVIQEGQTKRIYVYVDTKPGALGTIEPFLGINTYSVATGTLFGGSRVIGDTLNVG